MVPTTPHALREYSLLADGERGVLVGPRGDFGWMCFPAWESEALFSALVGGAGSYAIAPVGRFVWGGFYEAGTLIWRSRWVTDRDSIIECREALALPTDPNRAVVLRRVLARDGRAAVDVGLDLRARFGREPMRELARDELGMWHGRVGDFRFLWLGGEEAEVTGNGGVPALELQLVLEEGEYHDLVLVVDGGDASSMPDAEDAWKQTEAAWRKLVPSVDSRVGARDVQHALAVLSGLTTRSGGTVAAATMSLPERAREGRNYDYRYVWIRDQCFIGQAVAKAESPTLLEGSVRFVRERLLEHGTHLVPAYTARGATIPDEHHLDLPGYPGGGDVVGNHVTRQFQLDVFGEALLLFAAAGRETLEAETWQAVELAVEAIEARRREKDAGIWELDPDEWTHSRLICAAGLRAAASLSNRDGHIARCTALADVLIRDASTRAVHSSGRWQRSPGDRRVDASLLFPAIRGAIPPSDPRSVATLEAVTAELTEDGYVYRYRPDERRLGEAEGAFLLCGFLLSLAYAADGNSVESARWFERTRTACGPPGLLTEEFDVRQRQLRGNLPQAFVHAMLIEAALEQARD